MECPVHDRAKPKVLRDKKDSSRTIRGRTLSTVQRFRRSYAQNDAVVPLGFRKSGEALPLANVQKLPATSTIGIPRADVTDRQRPLAYRRVQDRYPSIVLDKREEGKEKSVRVVNGQFCPHGARHDTIQVLYGFCW